jgi:hypothetical protein
MRAKLSEKFPGIYRQVPDRVKCYELAVQEIKSRNPGKTFWNIPHSMIMQVMAKKFGATARPGLG